MRTERITLVTEDENGEHIHMIDLDSVEWYAGADEMNGRCRCDAPMYAFFVDGDRDKRGHWSRWMLKK